MIKPAGVVLVFLLIFSGCGRSTSEDRSPLDGNLGEKPIPNVPKQLGLTGEWPRDLHFQIRDVGESILVQLHATVAVAEMPKVARLNEMMVLSKYGALEWLSPSTKDCTLSQKSLDGVLKDGALHVNVQFWGWDKKGGTTVCRDLLAQARREGLQLRLSRVPVRYSAELEQVDLDLKPRSEKRASKEDA